MMGASLSVLITVTHASSLCLLPESSSPSTTPNLGDLPESCAALIIAHLDPQEICKLAKLNRAFRGASWADFVWESKLPSNYPILVEKMLGDYPDNLSRREIYTRLSRSNTMDDGTKKVWLDKRTGGVCLSISAKGLSITGIDDRRYWNHIPTDESRFSSIAYLRQTWWFEVEGEVDFPFPVGTYSVFFRLQLGRTSKRFCRRVCNTDKVHGWDIKPVQFQLWTSDGQHSASKCNLKDPGKWVHYHAGDFVVENSNSNTSSSTKIKFSATQIDCTHTKGGLCLDSVLVYPSSLKERLRCF